MIALTLAFALSAFAGDSTADDTHLWVRQAVGVAGWPSGLISDTRVQLRTPLYRSDSIVFRDTFAGVGARVAVTPVFLDVGPRVSIAPIDVFDIDLQASFLGYFGGGGQGLVTFEEPTGKLESMRKQREEDSVRTTGFTLSAAPTLKAKVGPIIAFSSWTFAYTRLHQPDGVDAPLTYEPYRDLVVAWEDVTIEHQAAVVYEVMPGGDRPKLWLGVTARNRMALESGDRSHGVGPLVVVNPGSGSPWVPTLLGQAVFYVSDADRVGPVPNLALLASWEIRHALGRTAAVH